MTHPVTVPPTPPIVYVTPTPVVTPAPTPAGSNLTDAQKKSAMLANIADLYSESSWYPYLLTDGKNLDIAVNGKLLIVATRLSQADTATAARICSSIAAITNDSDTAQPLGISSVVVISGGKQIAQCAPPGT
jgi:hypothetical protein